MKTGKLSKTVKTVQSVKNKMAKEINRIDKALNGTVLNHPVSKAIVPYMNVAGAAVDYFDSLLMDYGPTMHPQIVGGSSAGVSQTIAVNRSKPRITGSRGSIRIVHKELVSEVTMSGATATNPTISTGQSVYTVSPGNQNLFPWLSSIAGNYDYFKFNRVRLVYVPLCSTATTGRVMLGFDPDATDPISYSRQGLSSYSCSTDSSAWGVASLDCALPTNQPWYQTNRIGYTAQYSTNAQGQAFWATWAGAGVSTVGELYVLYDVSLKDPQPSAMDIATGSGSGAAVYNSLPPNSPASLSSTADTIKLTFLSTGVYDVVIAAKTTSLTAAIGISNTGGTAITPGGGNSYKVGDGTDCLCNYQVMVSNIGYSVTPGVVATPSSVTITNLVALGAYSVVLNAGDKTAAFPSFA